MTEDRLLKRLFRKLPESLSGRLSRYMVGLNDDIAKAYLDSAGIRLFSLEDINPEGDAIAYITGPRSVEHFVTEGVVENPNPAPHNKNVLFVRPERTYSIIQDVNGQTVQQGWLIGREMAGDVIPLGPGNLKSGVYRVTNESVLAAIERERGR
ncbi:MAG: hypothetical protein HY518_01245 [Candidatus Aenigmarchaeota archaeon]|nr:hypothetical protein [Candidatus Aenigmarchaeota archaeon]